MRSQTKNQVAYLSALTLLFSYIESILPRTVPFFRLGLGNIALLMSFSLPPMPFMALCAVKAAASSMMASYATRSSSPRRVPSAPNGTANMPRAT